MPDLADRLANHLADTRLLSRPGLALLAVSGGTDSVALLDLFSAIAPRFGVDLAIGHVDHGIAKQSGAVAEQVMDLGERYHVPARLRVLQLGATASETLARQERYRALRDVQRELGAAYLVTAHHADDQIETVLFRFLRGSGTAGLAGIAPRGPRGLVRPLLPFSRAELKGWLETRFPDSEHRPPVFDDPANRDPRHDRSWLRQKIVPALRERFGRLDGNLLAGQRQAARNRDAWSALVRQWAELDFRPEGEGADVARAPLETYDKALSEALLRAVAREAGCVLGARRAGELAAFVGDNGTSGRLLELGSGWTAELAFDRLRIRRGSDPAPLGVEWGATDAGSVEWGGWKVSWKPEPAGESTRLGHTAWFSSGAGEIRAARGGDRLFPLGGVGRRSVHRLLMEAKVPRSERTTYPVVVRGEDLLWVPGVCRAAGAVPAPGEISLRVDARHA